MMTICSLLFGVSVVFLEGGVVGMVSAVVVEESVVVACVVAVVACSVLGGTVCEGVVGQY